MIDAQLPTRPELSAEPHQSADVDYLVRWQPNRRAFAVLRNGIETGTFGFSRDRALSLAIMKAQTEPTIGQVSVFSKIEGRDITGWRRAARCTTGRPRRKRAVNLQPEGAG